MARTPLNRYLGLTLLLAFCWYYGPSLRHRGAPVSGLGSGSGRYSSNLEQSNWIKEVLANNSIETEVSFASRTLKYVPDAKERLSMTEVNQDLFPDGFTDIDVGSDSVIPLPSGSMLKVHVNKILRPDDVNASSLIFGVSTTFGRFNGAKTTPVKEWARWLTDGKGNSNGAGLVLALFNSTNAEINQAQERLTTAGINATVLASNKTLDMPGRYVDLVQLIWNDPSRAERKYFALIDDDTFFPNMPSLLDTLHTHNSSKPYYIGTVTERTDWIIRDHTPMAYGGGGIFLTPPVASTISSLPCLEKDSDGDYVLGGDQGDKLLYNCLHNYTEITLTYEPRLNQEDGFGDPSGLYESGRSLLSMHHYKSWHHTEPAKMHAVASACGGDCVLQRFQFNDNFIISNGWSVAQYPHGIDFDTALVEGTFELPNDDDLADVLHLYAYGALRKSLSKTGRKKGWNLLDAREEDSGRVTQVYIKRRGDERWLKKGEEATYERDGVIVLTWIP
ncbi:hypothetical protein LSUB1_G006750 [Lachnellula subtilissima]|uniref:Glycosyltransferase family 31 protein n=1 Tax=Lachnellula subtilissima TaxID=602034 RepID=A0A8H8RN15_9HELO|nr:hypothetical protein LSUB1_G006750 [Lachnellula subtilissima]